MFKGLMTEKGALFDEQKRRVLDGVVEVEIAQSHDEEYLTRVVSDYHALFSVYVFAKITRRIIEAGRNLKVIARYGVGTDNVDIKAATEHGIVVTYLPRYHLPSVPEHVIALILALARKIPACDRSVKSGHWNHEEFCGIDIEGKTLGILGMGRIGLMLAHKVMALGMKVIGYDPYWEAKTIEMEQIQIRDFETVVREADFLSVNMPLTAETRNIIGTGVFQIMKPVAFLINTARGPIVDEDALYDALVRGRIAGAALDVMSQEPPGANHKLYQLDNVIITPHVGGSTQESWERAAMTAAKSAVDVLQGKKPEFVKNPEVLARLNLK
jgi:D-3-phosphoglycerate dehydrogenase / 2-oxoglutarate reductase